jgi:hypothetical protein
MRPPATPASAPVHTEASALASVAPAAKPNKDLTLTGLYNVLQALREGRPLTAKEKTIHSTGLVGVLKTLHDELDAAVLAAYGWSDLACAQTTPAANVNPSALKNRYHHRCQRRTAAAPGHPEPAPRGRRSPRPRALVAPGVSESAIKTRAATAGTTCARG